MCLMIVAVGECLFPDHYNEFLYIILHKTIYYDYVMQVLHRAECTHVLYYLF